MGANSDVGINLVARTDEFETKLKKAIGSWDSFMQKGFEVSSATDKSFKTLVKSAGGATDEIKRIFDSFQIKSDWTLTGEKIFAEAQVKNIQDKFTRLASSAKASAREIGLSWSAANAQEAAALAAPNQKLATPLGFKTEATINAEKLLIEQHYVEYKSIAGNTEKDILRAHEAMVAKIKQLDAQLVTEAEKNAAAKAAVEIKAAEEIGRVKRDTIASYAAAAMNGEGSAAALIGQNQAGSDFAARLKVQMQEVAEATALAAREMTSYAAAAMNGEKAAAALIGQIHAGSQATSRLKRDMEEAAAAAQFMAREQASYAAAAMNGERAAAKLVGQLHAGSDFAKQLQSQMKGVEVEAHSSAQGMNLFGLASIGAILKIQILYSLVNSVMSVIGSAPGIAIDAVEGFRSAATANAAMITSMQVGVTDVGKAYQENKIYAEAVQEVLVKMDAQTAASAKQLSLMNREFVAQGVLIDTNNQKQIDGFRNIANALAALTSGDANKDQQYSQESKALLKGEFRPGDRLSNLVNNLDNGKLKEHLELWKKEGTVIEHIGALLIGFQAAQGDINALWETAKSTLTTIRDEILRDGFGPEFDFLVKKMQELGEYARDNKDKIVEMLQEGFKGLNTVASGVLEIGKGVAYLGTPGLWAAIGLGIMSLLPSITALGTEMTYVTGGLNLLMGLGLGAAAKGAYGIYEAVKLKQRAASLAEEGKSEPMFGSMKMMNAGSLEKILKDNPLITDAQIKEAFLRGVASITRKETTDYTNPDNIGGIAYETKFDKKSWDFAQANNKDLVKQPKGLVVAGDKQSEIDKALNLELRYQEKLAALVKATNSAKIQQEKDFAQQDLEILKGQYNASLISQQDYLSRRQAKELAANANEIEYQQATVDELDKIVGQSKYTGDKAGDIKRVEDATKLIEATKVLIGLQDQGAMLRIKFSNENADFYRKEKDYIKSLQVTYLTSIGDVIGAEKVHQTQLSVTGERYRLLADVVNKVSGAKKALAAFNYANGENLREETEWIKQQTAAYKDSIGAYTEAEAIRNSMRDKDRERIIKDLQRGVPGAGEALIGLNAKKAQDRAATEDKQWQENFSLNQGAASAQMNAIGGGSYVKQGFDIENEKALEDERIKTKYAGLMEEFAMEDMFGAKKSEAHKNMVKEKENADKLYADKKLAMEFDVAEGTIGIVKQAASDNKAIMLAMLIFEKGIAIAKIMRAAAVAEAEAMQYGPAAPEVMAGIAANETMAIAQVVASGAIEGIQMQKREAGGPVEAGKSYIVGEKRPELFTPGASGVITPYVPGSGGVTINQTFNAPNADETTLQRMKALAKQAGDAAKAEIMSSMNRGGAFALAGGRFR